MTKTENLFPSPLGDSILITGLSVARDYARYYEQFPSPLGDSILITR